MMLWVTCVLLSTCVCAQNINLGDLLGGLGGGGGGKGGNKPLCPAGKSAVPLMNQFTDATLYANGCGPQGMKVEENFGLFPCCNSHDICYGICGTTHKFCENKFKRCMEKICKGQVDSQQQAACRQQANGFSGMTAVFGVSFHSSSQQDACECVPSGDAAVRKHYTALLTAFYDTHQPEQAVTKAEKGEGEKGEGEVEGAGAGAGAGEGSEVSSSSSSTSDWVEGMLAKYIDGTKPKGGELLYKLAKKYGAQKGFVRFDGVKAEL